MIVSGVLHAEGQGITDGVMNLDLHELFFAKDVMVAVDFGQKKVVKIGY